MGAKNERLGEPTPQPGAKAPTPGAPPAREPAALPKGTTRAPPPSSNTFMMLLGGQHRLRYANS